MVARKLAAGAVAAVLCGFAAGVGYAQTSEHLASALARDDYAPAYDVGHEFVGGGLIIEAAMMQGYGPTAPEIPGPFPFPSSAEEEGSARGSPRGVPAVESDRAPVANEIVVSILPDTLPGPDGRRHTAFIPANFVLRADQSTTLIIVNYDMQAHTISAPELGVNMPVPGARPSARRGRPPTPSIVRYRVTLTRKGVFRWYCGTPCDQGAGGWAMTSGFDGKGRDGYMAGYFVVI